MIRQKNLPWKCTVDSCGEEANYHVGDKGKHIYYCKMHWSVYLGYLDDNTVKKIMKRKNKRKTIDEARNYTRKIISKIK